jgi:spermidine/putrescine-binding protein
MDKKILYILILIIAAGVAAFLVSRPVTTKKVEDITLVGSWQSVQDEKFIREFNTSGEFVDIYDETLVDQGTWSAFTKNNPIATNYPLKPDAVYLQIIGEETTQQVQLVKVTAQDLELMVLGSNTTLKFTRPQ